MAGFPFAGGPFSINVQMRPCIYVPPIFHNNRNVLAVL